VSERKTKAVKGKGRGAGAPAGSGGPSPVTLVLIGVAVVAVLIVGWNVFSTATDQAARVPVVIEDQSPENLLRLAVPVERGEASTPIVVMDFSDYSCPACRQFATQVKPIIDAQYVEAGLVRFQYYDYPIVTNFPNSFLAARAARCADDQGAYWAYHDQLFRAQEAWSRQADAAPSFEEYANQLGLDRGDFRSCLRSDRHAETVSANMLLGQELGVSGTPTIFLNTGEGRARRIQEWSNASQLGALIDEAIQRLGVTPAGGAP
jgi:protein-disulfide isomerase